MNRRKPRIDVAVVPLREGEDPQAAVLRKAVSGALASALEQDGEGCAFTAGYLAGFARQQALKHGLDAEADGGAALLAGLLEQAPADWRAAVEALRLVPRQAASSRARLGATDPAADAGYLVGHLEALCGTRKLLGRGGEATGYLTRCDQAADRLQTHHPTAVLRFDPIERAIVAAALAR